MCAGVGIADTGGLAGSASDFDVPANTGEMAAHFAMQKRPPGSGVVRAINAMVIGGIQEGLLEERIFRILKKAFFVLSTRKTQFLVTKTLKILNWEGS